MEEVYSAAHTDCFSLAAMLFLGLCFKNCDYEICLLIILEPDKSKAQQSFMSSVM